MEERSKTPGFKEEESCCCPPFPQRMANKMSIGVIYFSSLFCLLPALPWMRELEAAFLGILSEACWKLCNISSWNHFELFAERLFLGAGEAAFVLTIGPSCSVGSQQLAADLQDWEMPGTFWMQSESSTLWALALLFKVLVLSPHPPVVVVFKTDLLRNSYLLLYQSCNSGGAGPVSCDEAATSHCGY